MSLPALESWLRTRRGLLTLWLVTTAAVALVTLLMELGGVPGWDDAAHAYKVLLLRDGDSVFWDTYWYGGGYGAITYGFVFYWLAQYVSGALIVILVAGSIPVSFYLYVRDLWRIDDVWPAWGFALVMTLYLAHGQDPFVLALALTLAGLALLARRRPRVGGAAGRPRHLREPDGTGGRGAVRAHRPHRPAGGAAALRWCSPPPSPRPSSCASPSASASRSRARTSTRRRSSWSSSASPSSAWRWPA